MKTHTPNWTVDECPDSNGFSTIRLADGTPSGNTDELPIATVFLEKHAKLICRAVNSHAELLEACKAMLHWLEKPRKEQDNRSLHDLVINGRAAIAHADGRNAIEV